LEIKDLILFFGISRQYASLRDQLLDITDHVYRSGQVLDGEQTLKFEQAIARRCDRRHAISVGSGTQGLIFALQATQPAELKNSAVLIPAVSFAATLNAPLQARRRPVICDVDHQGLMDLATLGDTFKDIGANAVMYVNLYGNCLDYDKFRIHTKFFNEELYIIEDAAQSFGASYRGIPSGKMGDISVLSFDPTKNLPNYGSGGMVLTDDTDFADAIINFKNNGKDSGHHQSGTNSKMSESECAQMLVKLEHFDAWQRRRAKIADYYIETLFPYLDILIPNKDVVHSWHKFVVRVKSKRSRLQTFLLNEGVETKIHYADPLYDLPLGYDFADNTKPYQGAETLCRETLSLPIYPELTDGEVEHITASIKKFFS